MKCRGLIVAVLVASLASGLTGCGWNASAQKPKRIALVLSGARGDRAFNDLAAAGFDRATDDFPITPLELPRTGTEDEASRIGLARFRDADLIILAGYDFAAELQQQPQDGKHRYAILDAVVPRPDVLAATFAVHEGSYLVGAAAALKSRSGRIGFLGGVDIPPIRNFLAGYVAGARAVRPDIVVDVKFLAKRDDLSGFNAPDKANRVALAQYQHGADVIFHAAGNSGLGLFEAAKRYSQQSGSKVWAIGVDSDQYQQVNPTLRPYILTSMLKRLDVAVYEIIRAEVEGRFQAGTQVFDLKRGGVGYATSGGYVDDIKGRLDALAKDIAEGRIKVPDRV